MTDASFSPFQTHLDQDRALKILRAALDGAEDGELFLERSRGEALVFDDGRLRNASYDAEQGFGLRAVRGEVTGYAHSTEINEAALKKAAEDDRFADLKEKFDRVEAELKDDTQTNLETYRKEIVETINNDIVMRHGYSEGVIEHSLKDDPEVLRATEILGDGAEYTRIVTEQDTPRK